MLKVPVFLTLIVCIVFTKNNEIGLIIFGLIFGMVISFLCDVMSDYFEQQNSEKILAKFQKDLDARQGEIDAIQRD